MLGVSSAIITPQGDPIPAGWVVLLHSSWQVLSQLSGVPLRRLFYRVTLPIFGPRLTFAA